jgi:RecA/RadA recombinase
MDRIFVEKAFEDTEELLELLTRAEVLLQGGAGEGEGGREGGGHNAQSRVRLVVVDSICNLFRDVDHTDASELSGRSKMLYRLARLLKQYAYLYDVAVVVTNHVIDVFDDNRVATMARGPGHEMITSRHAATVNHSLLILMIICFGQLNCVTQLRALSVLHVYLLVLRALLVPY